VASYSPSTDNDSALDATSPRKIYLAGDWIETSEPIEVRGPAAPGEVLARTYHAGAPELEHAIVAAVAAEAPMAGLAAYERGEALREICDGIRARRDELAVQLAAEAGKPIRDAEIEIERGALTFRLAAEEAERQYGEVLPLDINAASRGRVGILRRFPVGAIAAISPFNLPLGLAAHKVAPALAAGCPIVLKVPSNTPLTMLSVAEIVEATGFPKGALSVLPMSNEVGDTLVTDRRFKLLTFTGSPAVGWSMKERAGKKKVVLELGSNAAAIIDATADLAWAAERCAYGAFKFGGQLCISVQRLFVHDAVWDEFSALFVEAAQRLTVGDPLERTTDIGPLIDVAAAGRLTAWIDEAVEAGGEIVVRGATDGAFMAPTVLANVPSSARICCEEAFGPVAILSPFSDFPSVLDEVNDSRFGLQAGIFTNDLDHAWTAFQRLHVGNVIVNDGPTYRVDNMPFGGVKDSGLGREGLRWAIEDMTEPRTMVIAGRP
jgi:acyl-CoA reductase-like NAD-dependent aldehyde dehydrogenase